MKCDLCFITCPICSIFVDKCIKNRKNVWFYEIIFILHKKSLIVIALSQKKYYLCFQKRHGTLYSVVKYERVDTCGFV